jgi:Zn finger protein HypA/HybF involved in hydrogenase expression
MHAVSIARSILEAVNMEMSRHAGAQARRIAVRMGELA